MQTIFPLPQEVITKIAAGEIIERPSYAVKELLENAIDAGANYITIQTEEAGLKKIMITDNGTGMNREDLAECFKLHTTSKISQEEQLKAIATLGFRGEALASIAAMSTVTIRSRKETDLSGTEVVIKNGIQIKISPIGLPVGTTVIVEQLFHAVPARKKFLKSQATELRHIIEIVTAFALAYPSIRFFLSHHGRTLLDLPKNQTLKDRIKILLGKDILEYVISLEHEDAYVNIHGYLAKPQITSTSTSKQYMFVNGRRVFDREISLALKNAYGNLLEPNSYPIFVLNFSFPPEMVDVNVHPRKELVAIENKKQLLTIIEQITKQTLGENNLTFKNTRWKSDPLYDEIIGTLFSPKHGLVNSYAGNMLKDSVVPWSVISKENRNQENLQLHTLYIVKQTEKGIALIDQHAAHERILFEQYSEEFVKNNQLSSVYTLTEPLAMTLSPIEKETILEYQGLLEDIGFVLREHGNGNGNWFIARIPSFIKDKNIKKYVRELLGELSEKGSVSDIDAQNKKMLAYLACRNAIKAGEKLTNEQMKELLEKLETTKRNATCPHGRPTMVEIKLSQLHTLFKRK